MTQIKTAAIVAIIVVSGCGDSIVDPNYGGPPLGFVSGTIPPLQGMLASHPKQLAFMVVNSERLANSTMTVAEIRPDRYPGSFTFPITLAEDTRLYTWARHYELADQGPVTLFAVSVRGGFGEPTTESAVALDDFIAYARPQNRENELRGFLSPSGPVLVPPGYSHVRRPCFAGTPRPAEVFPLDGQRPMTFTTVLSGLEWQMRTRAASCADLSLPPE